MIYKIKNLIIENLKNKITIKLEQEEIGYLIVIEYNTPYGVERIYWHGSNRTTEYIGEATFYTKERAKEIVKEKEELILLKTFIYILERKEKLDGTKSYYSEKEDYDRQNAILELLEEYYEEPFYNFIDDNDAISKYPVELINMLKEYFGVKTLEELEECKFKEIGEFIDVITEYNDKKIGDYSGKIEKFIKFLETIL